MFGTGKQLSLLVHELRELRELKKQEFEWFKSHAGLATKQDLKEMEKRMAMTSQQLETLLNNQTTQIGKVAKEQSDRFDALTAKIKELQDLIDAGGAITPEIEAAATNVQTALDNLDASIPDAPPTPA